MSCTTLGTTKATVGRLEKSVGKLENGRFADAGWKITSFGPVEAAEVSSTWARRLSANRTAPTFVILRAVAV